MLASELPARLVAPQSGERRFQFSVAHFQKEGVRCPRERPSLPREGIPTYSRLTASNHIFSISVEMMCPRSRFRASLAGVSGSSYHVTVLVTRYLERGSPLHRKREQSGSRPELLKIAVMLQAPARRALWKESDQNGGLPARERPRHTRPWNPPASRGPHAHLSWTFMPAPDTSAETPAPTACERVRRDS